MAASSRSDQRPWAEVAIAGAMNAVQARSIPDHDSESIQLKTVLELLRQVGLSPGDVDGVVGQYCDHLAYRLGLGSTWTNPALGGIEGVATAAGAIRLGLCSTVVVVGGIAGVLEAGPDTPDHVLARNEFVESVGMFTPVEFALIAQRHMFEFGTTSEQMATVASIIRSNGSTNPDAMHFGRGPVSVEDVLSSRMIAEPFHLLDCALNGEGGCALLVTTAERARDLTFPPVYVHGLGMDTFGPPYVHPPAWNLSAVNNPSDTLGWIGGRAARASFDMACLRPAEIDFCELYDPYSFEIIRQLEAFGFCAPGEGGPFVTDGNIKPDGSLPVNTDGGLLSFGHSFVGQSHQKIGRAVHQFQGSCKSNQLVDPEFALVSNGGAGALFNSVAILGSVAP